MIAYFIILTKKFINKISFMYLMYFKISLSITNQINSVRIPYKLLIVETANQIVRSVLIIEI